LLLSEPIDLNRATAADLLAIPWLNPLLAHGIIALRDSLGGYRSVQQLLLVEGMSAEWYEAIAPCVSVATGPEAPRRRQGGLLLRAGLDPLSPGREGVATLGRALLARGQWQFAAVLEKDRGETDFADWLGLSACHRGERWTLVAGDFTVGSGLGLVFSGAQRSASDWRDGGVRGPDRLRPAKTPIEERARRGAGVEFAGRGWDVALSASLTGRDARLNPDGTVARLVAGRVHDDSASRAADDAVTELALGSCIARRIGEVRATVSGAWVRYGCRFAPAESLTSFHGRALGDVGVTLETGTEHRRIAVEVAAAPPSGWAGAAEFSGAWQGASAGAGLSVFNERFFAPLGRSSLLTRCRHRLLGRAQASYRFGGLEVTLRGNTSCDYVNESLPGRVGIELTQRVGPLGVGLAVNRRFRLDQRTYRNSRWSAGYRAGPADVLLVVEDAYPEDGAGRGRMAAASVLLESTPWCLAVSGARFDISGSGIRMWLRERASIPGGGFGTSASAWRCSVAPGFSPGRGVRLTLGAGATFRDDPVVDIAGQMEVPLP